MHHGSAAPLGVKTWNNRWNKQAAWHSVQKGNSVHYAEKMAADMMSKGGWVFKGAPPPQGLGYGYGKGKGIGKENAAWDKGKGKGKGKEADAKAKGKGKDSKGKGKEMQQLGTKGVKGKDLTLKGGAGGKGQAPPGAKEPPEAPATATDGPRFCVKCGTPHNDKTLTHCRAPTCGKLLLAHPSQSEQADQTAGADEVMQQAPVEPRPGSFLRPNQRKKFDRTLQHMEQNPRRLKVENPLLEGVQEPEDEEEEHLVGPDSEEVLKLEADKVEAQTQLDYQLEATGLGRSKLAIKLMEDQLAGVCKNLAAARLKAAPATNPGEEWKKMKLMMESQIKVKATLFIKEQEEALAKVAEATAALEAIRASRKAQLETFEVEATQVNRILEYYKVVEEEPAKEAEAKAPTEAKEQDITLDQVKGAIQNNPAYHDWVLHHAKEYLAQEATKEAAQAAALKEQARKAEAKRKADIQLEQEGETSD